MPIGIDYFQPETFAQANPQFSAIQATQNAIQNAVTTAYTQPLLQQQLQKAQLANVISAAQAKYAQPQQLAATQYAQAQVPNLQAQTQAIYQGQIPMEQGSAAASYAQAALNRQNAAVIQNTMPYLINKAKYGQYTTPVLQINPELIHQLQNPTTRAGLLAAGIVTPQQVNEYLSGTMQGSINPSNTPVVSGQPVSNVSSGQFPYGIPVRPSLVPAISPGMPNAPTAGIQNTNQPQSTIQPTIQPTSGGQVPGVAAQPNMYSGNSLQNFLVTGNPWGPQGMAQLTATGKTTGSTNVSLYNTLQQKASERATQAAQMLNNLNQFSTNYDKSSLTGPIEGNLPASGFGSGISSTLKGGQSLTPEQLTDQASKMLAVSVVRGLFPKATNQELASVTAMKPSRTMAKGAKQVAVGSLQALGERDQQEPQFYAAAKNEGIPPQAAQTLWTKYFTETPWYNYQTNTPNPGSSADWQKYLTPQAVASLGTGQAINPTNPTAVANVTAQGANPAASTAAVQNQYQLNPGKATETVFVVSPRGQMGKIPATRLQAYLNAGYREAQ